MGRGSEDTVGRPGFVVDTGGIRSAFGEDGSLTVGDSGGGGLGIAGLHGIREVEY